MDNKITLRSESSDVPPEKRGAGILDANNHWLVLNESTRQEDGTWVHSCGTTILIKPIHQTVYDGYFLLSSSGKVKTIKVPFCPRCENEP